MKALIKILTWLTETDLHLSTGTLIVFGLLDLAIISIFRERSVLLLTGIAAVLTMGLHWGMVYWLKQLKK